MHDTIGSYLKKKRLNKVLPFIEGKLLDLGCGNNALVRQYGNGIGVDVYDWGDVDVIVKDSSQLPFDDEFFDTVAIIAALNHIPNRNDVIKEIHRVLKNNGKLLITMIPPGISKIWHLMRKPWDSDLAVRGMSHGEVYGISTLKIIQMVENGGFQIIRTERFMLNINCLFVFRKNNITMPTRSFGR